MNADNLFYSSQALMIVRSYRMFLARSSAGSQPFSKNILPKYLAGYLINSGNSVKYLGVHLDQFLTDNSDVMKQGKFLYAAENKLCSKFFKCSVFVKNTLFRACCSCFYAWQ